MRYVEENEAAGREEAREMSLLMDEQNDKSFHQTATDPDTTTSPSCSACSRQGIVRGVKDNLVMILTLLGVILGFLVGFGVSRTRPSDTVIMWLGIPGELFLNVLKMTIIPLVVSSVISSTASMDPKENGKISAILMSYLSLTNLMGALLGVFMAVLINPGSGISTASSGPKKLQTGLQTGDIIADLLRNMFPENLVRASIQKSQTVYSEHSHIEEVNSTDGLMNQTMISLSREITWTNSVNVLGLIFGSMMMGIACGQLKQAGQPFLNFFQSVLQVIMLLLQWLLWTAPVGAFSLIVAAIAPLDDMQTIFANLGLFVVTVVICCVIHQVVLLPLIYFVTVRKNLFKAYLKMVKVWLVGFASTSGAVAMPYMFHACESLGVNKRLYTFAIPTSVTFNGDGSAAFICVAVHFLAQLSGYSLDVSQLAVVCLLSAIFTLALPSVPSSSLVIVVIICSSLNIPPDNVALLFAVEWLLDRVRSSSNVVGEVIAVLITDKYCGHQLKSVSDDGTSQQISSASKYSDHQHDQLKPLSDSNASQHISSNDTYCNQQKQSSDNKASHLISSTNDNSSKETHAQ